MAESQDLDNEEFCYICFEGATRGASGEVEPLVQVCRCPTRVHRRCVARWQLYSAGKREEKSCRFCQGTLPDWKEVLTPRSLPPAVPVLSIYYNNTCCRMKVRPGPDGLQTFLRQLEVLVGRDVANVNFVFRCRCPDTGAEIFLQGLQAFEAAMHCACVRAAQRSLQHQMQQQALQQQVQHRLLQQQQLQLQQQALLQEQWQQQQQQPSGSVQQEYSRPQLQQPRQQLLLQAGVQQYASYSMAPYDTTGAAQPRRASAPNERLFEPAGIIMATAAGAGAAAAAAAGAAAATSVSPSPVARSGSGEPRNVMEHFRAPYYERSPQLSDPPSMSSPTVFDGGAAVTGLMPTQCAVHAPAAAGAMMAAAAAAAADVVPSEAFSGAFLAATSAATGVTACAYAASPVATAATAATLDFSPPRPPPPTPPSQPPPVSVSSLVRLQPSPPLPPPQHPPRQLQSSSVGLAAVACTTPRAHHRAVHFPLLGGAAFARPVASLPGAVHVTGATTASILADVTPDVATAADGSESRTTSFRAGNVALATSALRPTAAAPVVVSQAVPCAAASAPEPPVQRVAPAVSTLPPPLSGRHLTAQCAASTAGSRSNGGGPAPSAPSAAVDAAAGGSRRAVEVVHWSPLAVAAAGGPLPPHAEAEGSQASRTRAGVVSGCVGRGGGRAGGGAAGAGAGGKLASAVAALKAALRGPFARRLHRKAAAT